jgi:hypothetical protein
MLYGQVMNMKAYHIRSRVDRHIGVGITTWLGTSYNNAKPVYSGLQNCYNVWYFFSVQIMVPVCVGITLYVGESQPLATRGHLGHVILPRGSEDMTILRQGCHCNSFATIDMDSRISVK